MTKTYGLWSDSLDSFLVHFGTLFSTGNLLVAVMQARMLNHGLDRQDWRVRTFEEWLENDERPKRYMQEWEAKGERVK